MAKTQRFTSNPRDTVGESDLDLAKRLNVVAVTTTYTVQDEDDFIICSGASFTVSLPPALDNDERVLYFKHNDSTLGRIYTTDGYGAETIDEATTRKICTQNEVLQIVARRGVWHIIGRKVPSYITTYTPTTKEGSTDRSGKFTTREAQWQRLGQVMKIRFNLARDGTASGGGGGNFFIGYPSGVTPDQANDTPIAASGTFFLNGPSRPRSIQSAADGLWPIDDYNTTAYVYNDANFPASSFFGGIAFIKITDWEG